jgi:hypothetical protein
MDQDASALLSDWQKLSREVGLAAEVAADATRHDFTRKR